MKTWRGRISGGKVEKSRLHGLELVPTRPWGGRTDRGDEKGGGEQRRKKEKDEEKLCVCVKGARNRKRKRGELEGGREHHGQVGSHLS